MKSSVTIEIKCMTWRSRIEIAAKFLFIATSAIVGRQINIFVIGNERT